MKNRIPLIANVNLAIYSGLLPWGNALANIQMAFMILFFLILILFSPRHLEFNKAKFLKFIIFGSYFFICLISLLYTDNLERGIDSLSRKLPLIIFPAYILFVRDIDRKWIKRSLKVFSFSVLVTSLLSLVIVVIDSFRSFGTLNWNYITGANLSESLVSSHKLYFAVYIVFAILFLISDFTLIRLEIKRVWLKYASIFFLFFFLFLLGTRTAIIAAVLLVLILVSCLLLKRKEYLKVVFFFLGGIFLTLLALTYNPVLKERFKEAINYNNEYHISKQWGGTAVRKLIWKYAFKVVVKNPLFGVGIGDAQQELNKSYKNCKESSALKGKSYNSHSEALQILVNTGILGLIAFYGSQIFIILYYNRGNKLLITFFSLFFLCGLTESYLERDMGIRVYSFFSVLLFFLMKPNESTSSS